MLLCHHTGCFLLAFMNFILFYIKPMLHFSIFKWIFQQNLSSTGAKDFFSRFNEPKIPIFLRLSQIQETFLIHTSLFYEFLISYCDDISITVTKV